MSTSFASHGVKTRHNYAVANTSQVMQILSNYLYSDKIKSVIRELANNALDSHIMAGCPDRPIDVKFPTNIDLTFTIRDYGTGMSQEQMVDMYRFYGISDKGDNADTIGYMGIGSKSPFAYTDSFTSTTYYNGMAYTYVNAKNEDGIPTLNLINECETDEENGFEVSFAVNKYDINDFRSAAQYVFKHFPAIPSCIDIDLKEILLAEDNWNMMEGKKHWGDRLRLVVGYTEYEIDLNSLGSINDIYRELDVIASGHHIIIKCNMQDVDVSASREELQYTRKTIDYINSQLAKISGRLAILTQEKIDTMPSYYQACKYVTNHHFPVKNFTYNGKELVNSVNISIPVVSYGYRGFRTTTCNIAMDSTLLINDLVRGGIARIKAYITTNSAVLILLPNEDLDKLLETLGATKEDCVYTSTLPELPKNSSVRNINTAKCYYFSNPQYYRCKAVSYWKKSDIDLNEPDTKSFYVPLYKYHVMENLNDHSGIYPDNVASIVWFLNTFCNADIKAEKIVGVVKRYSKRFDKHDNWTNLISYFNKKLAQFIKDDPNVLKWIAIHDSRSNYGTNKISLILEDPSIGQIIDEDIANLATSLQTDLNLYTDDKYRHESFIPLIKKRYGAKITTLGTQLDNAYKKATKQYPLISQLNSITAVKHEVVDYINTTYLSRKVQTND